MSETPHPGITEALKRAADEIRQRLKENPDLLGRKPTPEDLETVIGPGGLRPKRKPRPFVVTEADADRMAKASSEAFARALHGGPREIAWLIEWPITAGRYPRWWHPVHGWVEDANMAMRLARKEDAEAIIQTSRFVEGVFASEHEWVALSEAPRP